jgi:hypothetical protein
MNAHERLERQLRASVAGAAARSLRSRLRLRLFSHGITMLVVAVTTTAVAAAAVTLVVSKPRSPGPIPRNVDDSALASAWNAAWAKDRRCSPGGGLFTRTNSTTAVPNQDLLATLPLLRRPATRADRLPSSLYHGLSGRLWLPFVQTGAVYVRYVRRARVADGVSFFLVPAEKLGHPPLSIAAADHCYELTVTALQAELPAVPKAERASTRRYGDAEFARGRYNLETSKAYDGAFLLAELPGGGGSGTGGQSPATIRKTGVLGFGGPDPSLWYGIVPVGVATVTLRFAASNHGTHHRPAFSATGNVVNNVFVISASRRSAQQNWPITAIWRAASGKVIKTINERPFHP